MKTLHTIYTSFAKRLVMVLIILTTIGIGSAWGEDYELVTTITDGEYVIGAVKGSAGNNTTIYAINSTDGTSWKSATEKTPSNGKISNPASSIVWTLTKTGDNSFTLKNGSIYLTIATTTGSGSVRSNSTSAGTIYFASTGSNSTFEISGVSTFTVSSGNQVGYNIGSGYRQYAQRNHSTATNSGSISTQFRFYKKTASTFTVTCQSNNSSYGTVSQPSVTNVANNTAISANGNTLTVGTTTVTATPNEQDADYTYDFEEWSGIPTGGKVTENVTVTANFTRTARALTNYRTTCSAQPSYSVTSDLSNVTSDPANPTSVLESAEELTLAYLPEDGWNLPATISVTMGGTPLSSETDYDWDNGDLLIAPASGFTGNIVVTINGWQQLATPTGLNVADITSSGATLSWSAVANASSYTVQVLGEDNEVIAEYPGLTEITKTVSELDPETNYVFGVVAVGDGITYTNSIQAVSDVFTTSSATCTITYDANGGTGMITDDKEYTNGAKVTVKGNFGIFTKDGYAFTGWNTAADGSGDSYKHNDQFAITANTILYAQWCKAYWKLVTDKSELENDTRIVIAAKDYNVALSSIQNNSKTNRQQVDVEKQYNKITFTSEVQILSLVGLNDNQFLLFTGDGYLYAASSDYNYLKTGTPTDNNGDWSIAISPEGVAIILAQGTNTNNQIKYNSTSKLFSSYGSSNSQKDVVIYKEVCKKDAYNVNTPSLTNATAANNNPTTVSATATSLNLNYSANTGYLLPETITVKMGGVALVSGTDYTWDKASGQLNITVTGFYGDIDVTIVAEEDPCYGFAMSAVTATSTSNSITLSWTAVEGATSYNVTLNPGDFSVSTGKNSHTFEGLSPKTEYTWEVQAVKGTCQASQTGSITTQKETFTVSWVVNGNTDSPYATESVVDGNSITLSPSDPEDNVLGYCASKFVGWSETDLGSAAGQSVPDDLCSAAEIKAKYTSLTEDKTFYAVFATGEEGTTEVSLSFADKAQRTSYSTEQQIWKQNGITLTNDKGSSTSNVGDYAGPARFYKNSSITIEYAYPMYKIVFDCNGDDKNEHITNLAPSIDDDNVQVNQEGEIVTVEFNEPVESYTITLTAGQVRLDNLTIIPIAYSNYVTQCDDLPTPTYAGPSIDKNELKVKCGERSSMNSAAVITFDPENNYDLSLPITLTASEGFLVSTNKTKNDAYTSSVTVNPVKSGDNKGKITQNLYVRAEASADTKADYTGTITIEGAQVETKTINVTAIVTCEPHTMTFYSYNTKTKARYYVGDAVEEPETPGQPCEGYVFDGWAESIVEEGATAYSKVTFPYEMPNRNTILYAVYQIQSGSNYTKVTEDLADYSGEYLIVYEDGKVAFNGGLADLDVANNNIGITIDGNTIESKVTTDAAKFTIAKVDGGYSIQSASGYYIGRTKDDNGLDINNSTKYINTIAIANDGSANIKSSGAYLRYNATSGQYRFRYYKSSSYAGQKAIALYKKDISYTSYPDCTLPIEPETPQALPSTFSVSKTEKVQFSAGNLQYHTSDKVWRFAPEQYDVLGEQNIELGNPNFKDWVDMFGWSSDGKYGVNASYADADYNTEEFVDWGTLFGDEGWYTMSTTEWNYLLYSRPNASQLKQVAKVGETFGVLLFPDDWVMPVGINVGITTGEDNEKYYAYTLEQWQQLEKAGAVFMPAAGRRLGGAGNTTDLNLTEHDNKYSLQYATNYYGYYWTATQQPSGKADFLINCTPLGGEEYIIGPFVIWSEMPRYGQSVRLVRKCADLQVVEWKENSVVVMYNGDPAQTATVTINNVQKGSAMLSDPEVEKDKAVYELPATDLASSPNKPLEIAIGNAKALMTIPYVATATTTNVVPNNSDLVVLKDATFTATNEQLRNVTVYGGGTLVVGEDATLSTNSLTLRAGGVTDGNYDYVYPEFVLNGTWTNTSGKINLDYLTTKEQYYTFVAPFAVNTKDIKYPIDIYGSNVAADNTGSYEFQYYDGAARAAGNTGWMVVNEDPNDDGEYEGATLTAGQGYTFLGMPKKVKVNGGSSTRQKFGIHRIPMTVAAANAMTHENSEQSITVAPHPSEKNNNSGWNLIGNPYMATIGGLTNEDIQVGKLVHTTDANGNWTGGWHWDEETVQSGQRFLVIPSNDGQSYEAVQASNATLHAFKNFFVQIGKENANALSIPRTKPSAQLLAPARRTEEVVKDVEVAIVLEQDEAHTDQMDFLINNIYTEDFERDADFTKMMNATNLNLYGVHPYDNLSFVAIDNNTARGSVAIGYQVPQAGEYTLRMSDKPYIMWDKFEALYVTDHEMSPKVTTDIMSEPYRFTVANAETNHTRFTVSVILKVEEDDGGGDVGTGVDNTTNNNTPCKFIYQDKMYILRNGVIYDAMGKQVQTINK